MKDAKIFLNIFNLFLHVLLYRYGDLYSSLR